MRYELTREVTKDEVPWLGEPLQRGAIVHRYDGFTYGCIGPGIACSADGETPFFELPRDALRPLED